MMMLRQAVVVMALMLVGAQVDAQKEQPVSSTPAVESQSARRRDAAAYLNALHAAESRAFAEEGRYLPLHEIGDLAALPVGFVPRLIADQWGYIVSLNDLFDTGGFAMFLDDRGTIYDTVARPQRQADPALQSRP
jgi:hypothetical protein